MPCSAIRWTRWTRWTRRMLAATAVVLSLVPASFLRAQNPASFSGRWNSDFGVLEMEQEGSKVRGTYPALEGTISGTLSGDRLDFQWQDPTYGEGWGFFRMQPDGQTLRGKWGVTGDSQARGQWNASRIREAPPAGVPSYWRVEGTSYNAGTLIGKATLYVDGRQVEGRLEGAYQKDIGGGPDELAVVNQLRGTVNDGVYLLEWRNPLDGSSGTMELRPVEEASKGETLTGQWEAHNGIGQGSIKLTKHVGRLADLGPDVADRLAGQTRLREAARLSRQSLYREAIEQYRQAIELFERSQLVEKLAMAYYGQGFAQMSIGRYDQARQSFQAVLHLGPGIDETTQVLAQSGLNQLELMFTDDPEKLLQSLQERPSQDAEPEPEKTLASVLLDLKWSGIEALTAGKTECGARLLELALELADARTWDARTSAQRGQIAEECGVEIPQQGFRHQEPEELSQAAVESERIERANLLRFLGRAHLQLASFAESRDFTEQALDLWRRLGSRENEAQELIHLAFLAEHLGQAQRAEESFRQALTIQELIDSPARWFTYYRLARLYQHQERSALALETYEHCLVELERLRTLQDVERTRIRYLWLQEALATAKTRPIEHYLEYLFELDRETHSFRALVIAERARSRVLADLMANDRPDRYLRTLIELVEDASPGAGRLLAKQVPALGAAAIRGLAKSGDAAYLIYFMGRERAYAWALRRDGTLRWFELPAKPETLSKLVSTVRQGMDPATPIPFRDALRALYAALVEPLWPFLGELEEPRQITVVPHGVLHSLPFIGLLQGDAYPLLDPVVAYAPSLTVANELGSGAVSGDDRILLIGQPQGTEDLKNARREVEDISTLFADRNLLLTGEEATIDRILAAVGDYDILHFATHGRSLTESTKAGDQEPAPEERDFFLQLAGDQKLGREELDSIDIDARLVVLSACQTQVGQRLAGDELMSLARSFLASGASAVLATLWRVEDAETQSIILDFYRHLVAGRSPAESLRQAQLDYLHQAETPLARRPYFWAPFILIGHHASLPTDS